MHAFAADNPRPVVPPTITITRPASSPSSMRITLNNRGGLCHVALKQIRLELRCDLRGRDLPKRRLDDLNRPERTEDEFFGGKIGEEFLDRKLRPADAREVSIEHRLLAQR